VLAHAVLTEEKEKILRTLATKLTLDNEYVGRELAKIQPKDG
jgi:hypothetical protein